MIKQINWVIVRKVKVFTVTFITCLCNFLHSSVFNLAIELDLNSRWHRMEPIW